MSTTIVAGRRASLRTNWAPSAKSTGDQPMASPLDKFPEFEDSPASTTNDPNSHLSATTVRHNQEEYWQPRKNGHASWDHSNGGALPSKHRPRKSIGEAIASIRTRNASVSVNAHDLADALKAPVSYKLITMCIIWYMTSAVTNTSSKSILNTLPHPITLTIVQFAFVPVWCLLLVYVASIFPSLKTTIPPLKHDIRRPSREVFMNALPLAIFQLAGHILSSMATSQIPVSLVHTIKGLSPLFTVLAYRLLFRIRYARATYLSLIPLTVGVMLACSSSFSTNLFGIICAFVATVVFVSQNIFSKKLFNEASRAEAEGPAASARKLDKFNLLYYCSGVAFIVVLPIWFLAEGYPLLSEFLRDGTIALTNKQGTLDHRGLLIEYTFNGISHFAQNILAFVILSMVSPVSYSVASLIKRVFVVVVAIVWFGNSTTPVQAFGIGLTFLGLYLYDRTSQDDVADQRAKADLFRSKESILPMQSNPQKPWDSNGFAFPTSTPSGGSGDGRTGYMNPVVGDQKKEDTEVGGVRPRAASTARSWLPPGTKQESTWQPGDQSAES